MSTPDEISSASCLCPLRIGSSDPADKLVIAVSPESLVNLLSRARCTTNRTGPHPAIDVKWYRDMRASRVVAPSCVLDQVLERQLDWYGKRGGWHDLGAEGTFRQPISDRDAQEREPRTNLGFVHILPSLLRTELAPGFGVAF